MIKNTLIIFNSGLYDLLKNLNAYQRIYFLSNYYQISYILKKNESISEYFHDKIQIINSPFSLSIFHLLYCIYWVMANKNKYDLLISDHSFLTYAAVISRRIFNKRFIIDIWDIPFRDLKLTFLSKIKRKLQVLFFRPIFKKADLYFVSIIPDFQLEEFKLSTKKMRCFTNAIFLNEYKNLPAVEPFDKFTILIQRSQFYKGFGLDLMLEAFELVLEKIDAQLVIVGYVMSEAKMLIDQFPFKDRISETGFVEHSEFKRLALRSHVCVIPFPKIVDLEQTYPIKAIEYMALGKAIVYTGIEGLSRIIDDAGLVVHEITPQNLADKIIYLHDHPEKRRELEIKAIERSRLFDAKEKNEKIFQEIKKLVA